jgi:hypothetical protein
MGINDKYKEKSFFEIKLSTGKGGVGEFGIEKAHIKFYNWKSKSLEERKIKLDFLMNEEDINFVKKFISNLNIILENKIYQPEGKVRISSDSFLGLDKKNLFDRNHISELFKSQEMKDFLNIIKRNILHTEINLEELNLFEGNIKKIEIPDLKLSADFF